MPMIKEVKAKFENHEQRVETREFSISVAGETRADMTGPVIR
jgi:hypothetical protein